MTKIKDERKAMIRAHRASLLLQKPERSSLSRLNGVSKNSFGTIPEPSNTDLLLKSFNNLSFTTPSPKSPSSKSNNIGGTRKRKNRGTRKRKQQKR